MDDTWCRKRCRRLKLQQHASFQVTSRVPKRQRQHTTATTPCRRRKPPRSLDARQKIQNFLGISPSLRLESLHQGTTTRLPSLGDINTGLVITCSSRWDDGVTTILIVTLPRKLWQGRGKGKVWQTTDDASIQQTERLLSLCKTI